MSRAHTLNFALLLVLGLSLPDAAFAQAWNKKPEKWTLAEAYQILRDSPWAPAKTVVRFFHKDIRTEYPSHVPVDAPRGSKTSVIEGVEWFQELPAGPPVIWWSSRTVRLAQQRVRQLKDPGSASKPLVAEPLEEILIVVEGSEPLRILRDTKDELHDRVYLELPDGMTLDFTSVEFQEGQRAGEDHVVFHFPRTVNQHPTIRTDSGSVFFHCKVTAKTERPNAPNTLTIRARFEPRKMRAAGQSDL